MWCTRAKADSVYYSEKPGVAAASKVFQLKHRRTTWTTLRSWVVPVPRLLNSFPWHLSANPVDLTLLLFVFLHRVIYLLVMRSKTLSGYSDNQPTFRVAENVSFPPHDCAVSSVLLVWGKSWEIMCKDSGSCIQLFLKLFTGWMRKTLISWMPEYVYWREIHSQDECPKIHLDIKLKTGQSHRDDYL